MSESSAPSPVSPAPVSPWSSLTKDLAAGLVVFLVALPLCLGIALGEYLIMIPANRLGYSGGLSGAQLKILQECVTLMVFVPFMMLFLGEKWKWDYLWAFCCLLGAVFFIFRPDRG